MTLAALYELTTEEFNLSDFRPLQEAPAVWTVTASSRQTGPQSSGKRMVGRGNTEEAALRDLRLQWVVKQYGVYRG